MTVPGVDSITPVSNMAAFGDFARFDGPDKLVSNVGLNPKVRRFGRSGPRPGIVSEAVGAVLDLGGRP